MINFRNATIEDAQLLWSWANEKAVRKNAFSQDSIPWESHLEWLDNKLNSDNCYLFVVEKKQHPIGQIRFDLEGQDNATVSVSLVKDYRGQGYGSKVIQQGTKYFLQFRPNIMVHAYVKKENIASKRAFEKADYQLDGMEKVKGFLSYHLTFNS